MKIKDVCLGITDGSHNPPQGVENSNYLMLSSKNIFDDEITFDSPRYLTQIDFEQENKRSKVKSGDVLLTIVGTVGRVAVVDEKMPQFTLQRSVAVLHPNKDICSSRYLMYALRGKRMYIESRAKGVAQKGIYLKEVADIELQVPEISKQNAIVEVLDKSALIMKFYQQQLQKLDELVKARFVEMFGDPELNPRGLPVLPWNAVFLTTTGKLDSNSMVENGRYPFFTCAKESYKIDSYAFDCEALLLAGNNAAGIYDVKHYKGKFNAYQRTYVLRLMNEKWSYILFKRQLEDKLQYLQSQSKGTNTRYLTLGILNELRFVVPPVAEQEQFAVFVEQTDKSKAAVQKALDEAQLLFDSLMQKYFG